MFLLPFGRDRLRKRTVKDCEKCLQRLLDNRLAVTLRSWAGGITQAEKAFLSPYKQKGNVQ